MAGALQPDDDFVEVHLSRQRDQRVQGMLRRPGGGPLAQKFGPLAEGAHITDKREIEEIAEIGSFERRNHRRRGGAFNQTSRQRQQRVKAKRLHHIGVVIMIMPGACRRAGSVSGNHDDGGCRLLDFAQDARGLPAVHVRHGDVQQHEVGAEIRGDLHALAAVAGLPELDAEGRQHIAHEISLVDWEGRMAAQVGTGSSSECAVLCAMESAVRIRGR
jgi:hypothetical protein